MPDALPLTGLFGKVPAHGDFVRRGLPTSFVGPWDSWLQDGMATARDRLGDRWAVLWDGAPPWRFALPAGACGPDAVAGVMLPSEDMVGRRFPITLAALLAPGDGVPAPAWFAALESAALAGRAGQADADALAAAIPMPGTEWPEPPSAGEPAAWPLAEPTDPPPDVAAPGDLLAMFAEATPGAAAEPMVEPADPPPLPEPVTHDPPGIVVAAEPADIHALPAVEALADSVPTPPDGSDVLGFFSDAPVAPATPAPASAPFLPMAEPPGADGADVLDMLGGVARPPEGQSPVAPEPSRPDGTLSFLLGEGAAAPASVTPVSADDGDPLAALIAAGDGPTGALPSLPEAWSHPVQSGPMASAPPVAEAFDPLHGLAAAPAPRLLPAETPEPPPGGGWWTSGGGYLPPSIRPRPALLPAAEFASLLEADA